MKQVNGWCFAEALACLLLEISLAREYEGRPDSGVYIYGYGGEMGVIRPRNLSRGSKMPASVRVKAE